MVWQVLDMLEEEEAVGQAVPVVCANHPAHVANIREVNDFNIFVRDGGCSLQCTARMPCGHTCSRCTLLCVHFSSVQRYVLCCLGMIIFASKQYDIVIRQKGHISVLQLVNTREQMSRTAKGMTSVYLN